MYLYFSLKGKESPIIFIQIIQTITTVLSSPFNLLPILICQIYNNLSKRNLTVKLNLFIQTFQKTIDFFISDFSKIRQNSKLKSLEVFQVYSQLDFKFFKNKSQILNDVFYYNNFIQSQIKKRFATKSMVDTKNKSSEQIERIIEATRQQMQTAQKNTNYAEAESCQLKLEQLKKDLEIRRLLEMQQRHKKQIDQINSNQNGELDRFQKYWDQRFKQHNQEAEKMEKDMLIKHQQQLEKMKGDLEKQLPTKTKQSSELLNLRKMQEYMVKQKNYGQAHKVQARIQELEAVQKQSWKNNRSLKTETLLNQHRAKQAAELTAFRKKVQTGLDEKYKEKKAQFAKLQKKFANISRQLKMQQQKEVLHFKGQFKSKGGQSSPMSTKSRIK